MPITAINQFIARYKTESMSESEKVDVIKQILKQMESLKAEPDPIHYTILFEHLSQIDDKFANKVGKQIKNGTYNQSSAENLFIELLSTHLFQSLPTLKVEELLRTLIKQLEIWVKSSENNETQIKNGIESITAMQDLPLDVKQTFDSEILPAIQSLIENTKHLKIKANDASDEVEQLKMELEKVNALAKTDELTNIPNRRGFNERAEKMLERCKDPEDDYTFSMVILDIDFFKAINDEFGHLIGDSVLRYLSRLLLQETKGKDFVARIGGEEFVLLLPRTELDQAIQVAENLRQKILKTKLKVTTSKKELLLTVSAGVSTYHLDDDIESIMDRADKALYQAKNTGRNVVKHENDLTD